MILHLPGRDFQIPVKARVGASLEDCRRKISNHVLATVREKFLSKILSG